MKIPPKILKYHVKLSGEETPATTASEPTVTPAAVELKPTPIATPDTKLQQLKSGIKVHAVKDIPKPAPVIKTPEKKENPEIIISKPDPIPTPAPVATPITVDKLTIEEAETQVKKSKPIAGKKTRPANRPRRRIKESPSQTSSLAKRIQNETQLQKSPESLPVLEAFQEFLDSEQRRMRRRMVGLSVFFTVIILLLIAGALAGAFFLIDPMRNEVNNIQNAIASLEQNSNASSANTASTITKLNEMIERERVALQNTTSKIETKVDTYSSNLTQIKDLITSLQSENKTLKTQLGSINRDLPDVTYKIAAIMNEIDKMRAAPPLMSSEPLRHHSTTV